MSILHQIVSNQEFSTDPIETGILFAKGTFETPFRMLGWDTFADDMDFVVNGSDVRIFEVLLFAIILVMGPGAIAGITGFFVLLEKSDFKLVYEKFDGREI